MGVDGSSMARGGSGDSIWEGKPGSSSNGLEFLGQGDQCRRGTRSKTESGQTCKLGTLSNTRNKVESRMISSRSRSHYLAHHGRVVRRRGSRETTMCPTYCLLPVLPSCGRMIHTGQQIGCSWGIPWLSPSQTEKFGPGARLYSLWVTGFSTARGF